MICDRCHKELICIGDILKEMSPREEEREIKKIQHILEIEEETPLTDEEIIKLLFCAKCNKIIFPNKNVTFFLNPCRD